MGFGSALDPLGYSSGAQDRQGSHYAQTVEVTNSTALDDSEKVVEFQSEKSKSKGRGRDMEEPAVDSPVDDAAVHNTIDNA